MAVSVRLLGRQERFGMPLEPKVGGGIGHCMVASSELASACSMALAGRQVGRRGALAITHKAFEMTAPNLHVRC